MSFRAGDTVRYLPLSEEWVLACDEDRGELFPAGWPESVALAEDCELVEAATDEERLTMLKAVAKQGSYRGDIAKRQLKANLVPPSPAGAANPTT